MVAAGVVYEFAAEDLSQDEAEMEQSEYDRACSDDGTDRIGWNPAAVEDYDDGDEIPF